MNNESAPHAGCEAREIMSNACYTDQVDMNCGISLSALPAQACAKAPSSLLRLLQTVSGITSHPASQPHLDDSRKSGRCLPFGRRKENGLVF